VHQFAEKFQLVNERKCEEFGGLTNAPKKNTSVAVVFSAHVFE